MSRLPGGQIISITAHQKNTFLFHSSPQLKLPGLELLKGPQTQRISCFWHWRDTRTRPGALGAQVSEHGKTHPWKPRLCVYQTHSCFCCFRKLTPMTFDTKIDLIIERQQLNRGHVHSVHFTGVARDSPDVRNRRVFGDSNIFDQEDELGRLK